MSRRVTGTVGAAAVVVLALGGVGYLRTTSNAERIDDRNLRELARTARTIEGTVNNLHTVLASLAGETEPDRLRSKAELIPHLTIDNLRLGADASCRGQRGRTATGTVSAEQSLELCYNGNDDPIEGTIHARYPLAALEPYLASDYLDTVFLADSAGTVFAWAPDRTAVRVHSLAALDSVYLRSANEVSRLGTSTIVRAPIAGQDYYFYLLPLRLNITHADTANDRSSQIMWILGGLISSSAHRQESLSLHPPVALFLGFISIMGFLAVPIARLYDGAAGATQGRKPALPGLRARARGRPHGSRTGRPRPLPATQQRHLRRAGRGRRFGGQEHRCGARIRARDRALLDTVEFEAWFVAAAIFGALALFLFLVVAFLDRAAHMRLAWMWPNVERPGRYVALVAIAAPFLIASTVQALWPSTFPTSPASFLAPVLFIGFGLVPLSTRNNARGRSGEAFVGWGLFAVAATVLVALAWAWRPRPALEIGSAGIALLLTILWSTRAEVRERADGWTDRHNLTRHLYTTAMSAGLLVVGVLPGYLAYQIAFLDRSELLFEHHQLEVAE